MSAIGTTIHDELIRIRDAWGQRFSELGTIVHDKITGLWTWLTGFVSGWPAQALQWGANLIGGLISGIEGAVGGLFSTIGGIADKIKGMLGFHSPPKLGPLADADKYMPNMMAMFSEGIVANMPAVQKALGRVALPISATMSGHYAPGATPSSGGPTINIYISTMAGSRAEVERMADLIEQEMARRFRGRGQTPGYSAGGVW